MAKEQLQKIAYQFWVVGNLAKRIHILTLEKVMSNGRGKKNYQASRHLQDVPAHTIL